MIRSEGKAAGILLLAASLLIFACQAGAAQEESSSVPEENQSYEELSTEAEEYEKQPCLEENITDNDELYADQVDNSVITMHLTVSSGNSADGSDHTWKEINTYSAYDYEKWGVDRYQVEGILQIDDGDGIAENDFGYGEKIPNVSVQIRGQTSSYNSQKNYKIRIRDGKGSWNGQRTLNLNKHQTIPFRFNNKLAYDLLKDIPELLSCRTQFVHLYVTDCTEGGTGEEEDYGLFVMVEQINRTYLKSHGLDDQGELYKVNYFEWGEYEPLMQDPDSEDYDRDAFEEYLEIKGQEDHSTLQQALEALQNYQVPIQDIVDKYFNQENLMYWVAFQILIGNYDAGSRNLFLYSPQNSDRLYIISWDMDVCFLRSYYESTGYLEGLSWERGMTQYLSLVLFNRMFKEEVYRTALDDAICDLKDHYLTEEKVSAMVSDYTEIVTRFLFEEPDKTYSDFSDPEAYENAASMIAGEVQENYERYLESLNGPWPFYVGVPVVTDQGTQLIWNNSYDYRGESVTYDYCLAEDYNFEKIITEGHGLSVPTAEIGKLDPGIYFLKVTATNASGYTVDCFDYYVPSGDIGKIYGCYSFMVSEDGSVSAVTTSEVESSE